MSIANDSSTTVKQELTFSVLIPMFNEADMILPLFERLSSVLLSLTDRAEIVIVDDGSHDGTWALLQQLPSIKIECQCIRLSRNFGKEAAISAGLEYCKGQAVIIVDADLQDPPELIPRMLDTWQQGFDIVNMKRISRKGESWFKRFTASCFYHIINWISDAEIPKNVGDFRLLSRAVVEAINQLPERNRFMKGIFSWPGFQQITLSFEREPRYNGQTKWNYRKLCSLAMDGITSLSIKPLRLATWCGVFILLFTTCYVGWTLFSLFMLNAIMHDYFPLIVTMLGLSGVQFLALGLIGEYLGRVFVEVKQRPLYCIEEVKFYHSLAAETEAGL